MKKVGIVMGSDSDLPILRKAMDTLSALEIPFECHIYSAHRTPVEARDFAVNARANDFGCIIAAAGMAAHLAGAIAANTTIPVIGIPCMGLNGGPEFKHSEAFSFQVATDDQAETDRLWTAIVGNGGQESACGWCKDRWGLSWQITPRTLTEAMVAGGAEAKRAFDAMMTMKKIDVARIDAARRG